MKNLFINIGSTILARNFCTGIFSCEKISAQDAKILIEGTIKNNKKVVACYDFGPVPSEEKSIEFKQLLEAFRKTTNYELRKSDFFREEDEYGDIDPHFDFCYEIDDETDMLIVEYYFSTDSKDDPKLDNIFPRMNVSEDSMDFYLFSKK